MACINCDEYTCTEPIPTCTGLLNIGFPFEATTGEVRIWVEKQISGERLDYVQRVEGYSSGVLVDLTNPREQFYNEFDGVYVMWVTNIEDDRSSPLALTIQGLDYNKLGVTFVRTRGNKFPEATAKPII